MNQGILKVVFTSEKTIKYIDFKYNLLDWIILNPNFQIKIIKGESSIPNHSTHEICRVHETIAPKKNTQAPSIYIFQIYHIFKNLYIIFLQKKIIRQINSKLSIT